MTRLGRGEAAGAPETPLWLEGRPGFKTSHNKVSPLTFWPGHLPTSALETELHNRSVTLPEA